MRIFVDSINKGIMTGKVLIASAVAMFTCFTSNAQLNNQGTRAQQVQLNTITTAVPFLLIAPDSRSGGIGDAGVALSADANSIHWNPAKMAFAENEFELSMSYSPWLRKLVNDMNLAYLSGYKKLNKNQAIGGALRFSPWEKSLLQMKQVRL